MLGRHAVPIQFLAQRVVVVMTVRMQHREAIRKRCDAQRIALLHCDEFLHVAVSGRFVCIDQMDVDGASARQDDRAIRERVRRDRHQDHGLDRRVKDRAACGHRVSGGTRGGGDDQTVGALRSHRMTVDKDGVFDHGTGHAVRDAGIIDGRLIENDLAVAIKRGVHHGTRVGFILTAKHRRQVFLHVGLREVGDKAQTTGIDGDDGKFVLGHASGDAERSAVAANDDDHVGVGAQFLKTPTSIAFEVSGRTFFEHGGDAFLAQNVQEGLESLAHGFGAFGKNSCGFKCRHARHYDRKGKRLRDCLRSLFVSIFR